MESVRTSVADPDRRRFVPCVGADGCGKGRGSCGCGETLGTSLVPIKNYDQVGRFVNSIPLDILNDTAINEVISGLPSNYNFEIHKSVWQVRKLGVKRLALQLPEGLQRYALVLRDIHVRFGGCEEAIILGDVAYGACCIDDFTAELLGCDMIIHYGHSCLIPVTETKIPVLYIFVEITLPCEHLIHIVRVNFAGKRIALMATVQYVSTLHRVKSALAGICDLFIPQIKPLSPGEVLGCTSPKLPSNTDALLFVADGRFHLEAAMIANPTIPAYRFDPFTQTVFEEGYDHLAMLQFRKRMIDKARDATNFGIILGTLGRQGNLTVLNDLVAKMHAAGKTAMVILTSEVRPETLGGFPDIEAWVQTSCPRLSIDWNYTFDVPLLTPYEFNVMLGAAHPFSGNPDGSYPMDFYATGDATMIGGGPWAPGYNLRPPRKNKA